MSARSRSRAFGRPAIAFAVAAVITPGLAGGIPAVATTAGGGRSAGAPLADRRSYDWSAKARVAGSADNKEIWVTGRGTVRATTAAEARAAAVSAMREQASRWGRVLEVVVSSVE